MTNNPQKTLTVVSVTGSQTYAEGSMYAIMRSYRELQKKLPQENLKCLLVCPERPANCPDYILHAPCKPFSYLEYNYFIIYGLGQLIDTDFALIVQNDGFVVNGDNWRDEFFEYDYIGAPIPAYYIRTNGNIWRSGLDNWLKEFDNFPEGAITPQNGGFSLRSKRLLDLPMLRSYPWSILPPVPFQSFPLELKQDMLLHNEDLYLCLTMRNQLESEGVKFASTELANLFSIESGIVAEKYQTDLKQILGVHTMGYFVLDSVDNSLMRKPLSYKLNAQNMLDYPIMRIMLANNINIHIPKEFME